MISIKLKQIMTTKSALQKTVKGILYTKEEERYTQAQELGEKINLTRRLDQQMRSGKNQTLSTQ
jgi:hypothetical protein